MLNLGIEKKKQLFKKLCWGKSYYAKFRKEVAEFREVDLWVTQRLPGGSLRKTLRKAFQEKDVIRQHLRLIATVFKNG